MNDVKKIFVLMGLGLALATVALAGPRIKLVVLPGGPTSGHIYFKCDPNKQNWGKLTFTEPGSVAYCHSEVNAQSNLPMDQKVLLKLDRYKGSGDIHQDSNYYTAQVELSLLTTQEGCRPDEVALFEFNLNNVVVSEGGEVSTTIQGSCENDLYAHTHSARNAVTVTKLHTDNRPLIYRCNTNDWMRVEDGYGEHFNCFESLYLQHEFFGLEARQFYNYCHDNNHKLFIYTRGDGSDMWPQYVCRS